MRRALWPCARAQAPGPHPWRCATYLFALAPHSYRPVQRASGIVAVRRFLVTRLSRAIAAHGSHEAADEGDHSAAQNTATGPSRSVAAPCHGMPALGETVATGLVRRAARHQNRPRTCGAALPPQRSSCGTVNLPALSVRSRVPTLLPLAPHA